MREKPCQATPQKCEVASHPAVSLPSSVQHPNFLPAHHCSIVSIEHATVAIRHGAVDCLKLKELSFGRICSHTLVSITENS